MRRQVWHCGAMGGAGGETAGRVLVVDDEAGIRDVLGEILSDEGYEVRLAADGAAGLEVLHTWAPDVILLDINMPVLDGYGFARACRERGYRTPIVVITAGERAPHAAERAGAVAYVAKPFDLDTVVDAVRTHRRAA